MSGELATQVRQRLAAYVREEISIADLWHWIAEHVLATDTDRRDPAVQEVAGPAVLLMYEYQAGHRTEEDLRARFRALSTTYSGAISSGG